MNLVFLTNINLFSILDRISFYVGHFFTIFYLCTEFQMLMSIINPRALSLSLSIIRFYNSITDSQQVVIVPPRMHSM